MSSWTQPTAICNNEYELVRDDLQEQQESIIIITALSSINTTVACSRRKVIPKIITWVINLFTYLGRWNFFNFNLALNLLGTLETIFKGLRQRKDLNIRKSNGTDFSTRMVMNLSGVIKFGPKPKIVLQKSLKTKKQKLCS